jgi:hypothetical protein
LISPLFSEAAFTSLANFKQRKMNMKTLSALVFSIAILAIPVAASAGQWSTAPVTISQIEVSDAYASGTTNYTLMFSSAPITTNCSNGSSGSWLVGGTGSVPKDIITQATAAKLAGRSVKVFWSGCTGGGTSGSPVLMGLTIL